MTPSSRTRRMSATRIRLFALIEARGRLVQEQDLGLGGQRPRPLHSPLVAIGQIAGELVLVSFDADEFEPSLAFAHDRPLFASLPRQVRYSRQETVRATAMAARHDILQDSHFSK